MIEENEKGKEDIEVEADNEEINSFEELEEKKREVNEFNADGNSAQNQIFIQDAGTGGFTINYYVTEMRPIESKLPVERRYDLCKQEECIEFVETFKDSEYFTTAILLCVFEAVILADLSDLRLKIEHCLIQNNANNIEEQVSKSSKYISLDAILAVIKANKFVTKDGKLCVSIGENSSQALINMLEQFPFIQGLFQNFSIDITQDSRYHTYFYESQLASSFVAIWSAKVIDLQNHIYPKLCENPDNTYLLGYFVYKLYKKMEKKAKYILWQYLLPEKNSLWRVACFAYILFRENNINFPLEKELKMLLIQKVTYYKKNDFYFISKLLMQSKFFRNLVCCAYSSAYMSADTREKQRALAQSYIYLVRRSYYRVNYIFVELPLVSCDTRQQQEYLAGILERVMADYRLRKQLYAILKAYLKEVSKYKFSEKGIKHLAAFFYNMYSSNEVYREDIRELLQESGSTVARRVCDLL